MTSSNLHIPLSNPHTQYDRNESKAHSTLSTVTVNQHNKDVYHTKPLTDTRVSADT